MFRVDIQITLTLKAPLITQATAPGAYGLDVVFARNAEGRPIIAGTHVAGKLREAWERLRSALGDTVADAVPKKEQINEMLGDPASDTYEPQTKQLFLSDFVLTSAHQPNGVRHRIRIDPYRGAVDKGALLALENLTASGDLISFRGTLRFEEVERAAIDRIRHQLVCGLQWVPHIGAHRTIGFGRVHTVEVDEPQIKALTYDPHKWEDADGFDLIFEPQEPFCIAAKPIQGNLFESREEIPGNVIRACLARKLKRLTPKAPPEIAAAAEQLSDHFSKVRVTHAFPSKQCHKRPVRPPLSLIKTDHLHDAALLQGPVLIDGRAPEFAVDWKDRQDVDQRFGWPHLRRELRVRTAIDRKRRRHADQQLFAYEMIVPREDCWVARLDASAVDESSRPAVLQALSALLENGLLGMGKSKAPVKVSTHASGTIEDVCPIDRVDRQLDVDRPIVLTLQTPALLLDTRVLKGSSDAETLFETYRSVWNDLSPAINLERFFATQSLSGGRYQHGRFQQQQPYKPWLLTDAGSVFVFSTTDADQARDDIDGWLCRGLPLPTAVLGAYDIENEGVGTLWSKCPFIPQNGFGEIAVNLEIHRDLRPPENKCHPVISLSEREE